MHNQSSVKGTMLRLISEFFIIVVGVLVALAVDEWRTSVKEAETRNILLNELLQDLKEDAEDMVQFEDFSIRRKEAATALLNSDTISSKNRSKYMRRLSFSARLEIVESTFQEMTNSGSFSSINDMDLRIAILSYYGLAKDRVDINDLLLPQMLRYRAALEELGYSSNGSVEIPKEILMNPKVHALIITLGSEAGTAYWYVQDIKKANAELIEKLTASLNKP